MPVSESSKLPKQAIPVERSVIGTAIAGQPGGIEASGLLDILLDELSSKQTKS